MGSWAGWTFLAKAHIVDNNSWLTQSSQALDWAVLGSSKSLGELRLISDVFIATLNKTHFEKLLRLHNVAMKLAIAMLLGLYDTEQIIQT